MPTNILIWCGVAGVGILGLTWVAYPVGVFLVSALLRRGVRRTAATPEVTVVLATRDPRDSVRRRVRNLLRTRHPAGRLRIVVAADQGTDLEPGDLDGLGASVALLPAGDRHGKAEALNAGVAAASGDLVVFADAGQRFDRDTIPELASAFSDEEVGAASGSLRLRSREEGATLGDLYWRFERWLREHEGRIHSPVGVTGAVWAMRRSLWEPLPGGLILDDVYTPMRLATEGHRIAFVESAAAYETRRPSAVDEFHRKARTLTGVFQLCAWLPSVLVPWKNPLFLQFLIHKLFRLVTPFAGVLVALGLLGLVVSLEPTARRALGLTSGLALLWIASGWTRPARLLRSVVVQLAYYQASAVRAALNAARGRWDVWD